MTKREKRFDFCWGSVRWRDLSEWEGSLGEWGHRGGHYVEYFVAECLWENDIL